MPSVVKLCDHIANIFSARFVQTSVFTALLCGLAHFSLAQTSVLTYQNDNARTGQNLRETLLNPANVSGGFFGKLFSRDVDGYLYAQPLVVSGLTIGGKTRNVVLAATGHNTVYAFDADDLAAVLPLWQTHLGSSVPTPGAAFGDRYGPYHDIPIEIGIVGTPVIDAAAGTLYVVAFTQDADGGAYHQMLYALDISTGQQKAGSPVEIKGSVPGTGDGSVAGVVSFLPMQCLQRPALLLDHGTLYVAFASHADTNPYHGWMFAYDPATLAQTGLFCTTPNGDEAGIWMSGAGPAADADGNIYCMTGNGAFTAAAGGADYGESFVKLGLTNGSLSALDYFTPFNQQVLNFSDFDLGSGGVLLLPDQAGTVPHLLVGAGKEGKIYLLNRDTGAMGQYHPVLDNAVQTLIGATGGCWSKPAYFNQTLYYATNRDFLKAFPIIASDTQPAQIAALPASQSPAFFNYPGATPSISANGNADGIVWALEAAGTATLHAYDAADVSKELYSSNTLAVRDAPGAYVKFTVPTIANGKVYVGTQYKLSAFGIGEFLQAPSISPVSGNYFPSVQVSLSNIVPDTEMHYTTDGTPPTAASPLYTAPFTLTDTTTVQAFAMKTGAVPSGVATAYYLIDKGPGDGKGLLGIYYDTVNLNGNTFSQVDSAIDFAWGGNAPVAGLPAVGWSARWTGNLLPRCTGPLTFYMLSEDGVRVWVNDQLLMDNWTYHTTQEDSGTISLVAGQAIHIKIEHFQAQPDSQLQLSWSGPGLARQVIPQSQLYSGESQPVQTPQIVPGGGSFSPSVTVTLKDATPDAEMHYTTDGSAPTAASARYTAPFALTKSAVVRVIALRADRPDSTITQAVFTLNPNLAAPIFALNAGGPAFAPFAEDADFVGGAGHTRVGDVDISGVTHPAPQPVYQSERIGDFTYTLPDLTPNASYIVRLHFAECTAANAGERVFNVSVNGQPVLTNFDIYAAVGPLKALAPEFMTNADSTGTITIAYTTVTGAAKGSGIEVFAANASVTITGAVLLDNISATAPAQNIRFEFRPASGAASFTRTAAIKPSGGFAFADIPADVYNVAIKGDKWLQKVVRVDAAHGTVFTGAIPLSGGDANNDNVTDIADFGILVNAYGGDAATAGSGYDTAADFDCDGAIDIADFGILVNNYASEGDP